MADGKLPLSPASPGGQIEDVEQLNVPSPVPPPPGPGLIALVRQRVQTVGRLYNQIAAVLDADPAANEFGLVTRNIPSGLQNVAITDGVDGPAAVTPAATAPTVADPALVVSISPNSGAIMASDASVAPTNGPVPGSTQQNGGTDGADIRANHMFDLDTGAGEEWNLGVNLRLAAPGGSVEGGTAANPLRIDPTGTTTQPISNPNLDAPLSTLATETTLVSVNTNALDIVNNTANIDSNTSSIDSKLNTLGQKLMAASVPVVIASNQSAVPVSGTIDNNSVGLDGAAPPAYSTQIGGEGTDGNLTNMLVLSSSVGAGDRGLVVRNICDGTQDVNLTKVAGNAVTTQAAGEQLVAVEGRAANGAAVAGNPVLVGAEDASGNTQRLRTAITLPGTADPGTITRNIPTFYGTQANAWNATAVAANGTSNSIDTQLAPNVSVFGNTSGVTRIAIQLSQDNVNFYDVTDQNVPGGGDFGISGVWGARYIRLKSSQARTITATISAKG